MFVCLSKFTVLVSQTGLLSYDLVPFIGHFTSTFYDDHLRITAKQQCCRCTRIALYMSLTDVSEKCYFHLMENMMLHASKPVKKLMIIELFAIIFIYTECTSLIITSLSLFSYNTHTSVDYYIVCTISCVIITQYLIIVLFVIIFVR